MAGLWRALKRFEAAQGVDQVVLRGLADQTPDRWGGTWIDSGHHGSDSCDQPQGSLAGWLNHGSSGLSHGGWLVMWLHHCYGQEPVQADLAPGVDGDLW